MVLDLIILIVLEGVLQIINLLIMTFSPCFSYFLSLRPRFLPQHTNSVGKVIRELKNNGVELYAVFSLNESPLPYSRISMPERYYFFQISPQLYSRGWADPVPDPLLLRKSGSDGNRTRDLWICSQELWSLDYRGGRSTFFYITCILVISVRTSQETQYIFYL
jgi:hypothetical protein